MDELIGTGDLRALVNLYRAEVVGTKSVIAMDPSLDKLWRPTVQDTLVEEGSAADPDGPCR